MTSCNAFERCAMTRKILTILAASLLLALTVRVDAYRFGYTEQGHVLKWQSSEAVFYVVTTGLPSGFHQPMVNAMETWTNAPSNFRFRYGGTTSQANYSVGDGINLIGFAELPMENAGYNHVWYWLDTGQIFDSDIILNSRYRWSTTGDPNAYDVETIALHELGHTLWLSDLYNQDMVNRVMFGIFWPGLVKRNLHQGDINGIVALHGSSSSSGGGGGCTVFR
jgi:hypothetical protein